MRHGALFFGSAMAWYVGAGLVMLWRQVLGNAVVPDLALAAGLTWLLLHGRAALPGLGFGAVAAVWTMPTPEVARLPALADACLALAAAAMAARVLGPSRPPRLASARGLARFAVVCVGVSVAVIAVRLALEPLWGARTALPAIDVLSDALGLMLVTPALLSWFGRPGGDWRQRRLALGVVVPLLALLTSGWTARYSEAVRNAGDERFRGAADITTVALRDRLQGALDALATIESLLLVSPGVDQASFEQATRAWAGRHDLHALGVVQQVTDAELPAFEALLAAHGAPTTTVRSATGDGGVRPRAPGEPTFAIRLIAPRQRNSQVLGINSYANPRVAPVIDRAIRDRRPAATQPFPLRLGPQALPPSDAPVLGLVLYQPISERPQPRENLAFVTLRFDQILPAGPQGTNVGLLKCLFDPGDVAGKGVAFNRPEACRHDAAGGRVHREQIAFAGLSWTFEVRQPPALAWLDEGPLVEGLALGALAVVALLLLSITGHARLYERVARRARTAQAGAEAADRAKTDFLDRLRHELRAPLNALLGATQILRRPRPLTLMEVGPWVERIDHASQHLRDMIDELIDTSASEAGQLQVRDECVQLAPLVASSVEVARQAGQAVPGLIWQVGAVPDGWRVRGDSRRIRQVLVNLLTNAAKYNRENGRVRLTASAVADTIALRVEDDGAGMTPAEQDTLFTAFNRLGRESTDIEGMGLGLFLSRQFAQRMGGRIEVESNAGRGSAFTLVLPRGPDAEAAFVRAAPTSLLVLAFEDDPIALAILQAVVDHRAGWCLEHRDRVSDGLEVIRSRQPDVVLLDQHLPDGDGDNLFKQMQDDPELRHVPVVLVSANAVAPGRGARAAVPKPWDLTRLEQVIEEAALHRASSQRKTCPGED